MLRSLMLGLALAVSLALVGCDKGTAPPPKPAASGPDAAEIVKRYLATTNCKDSTVKMRATITDSDGSASPVQVDLTIFRKRSADGTQNMLVEFTGANRDRSALVTISPRGEVEGVRYAQSNDTFVTTNGVMTEESLFGMTMQELADGQPEKYDFKLTGEVPFQSGQAYRLEGRLKDGAESKFPRIILLISKESYGAVGAEFYDNHDELARRITVSEGELRAGYWTRLRWTLENVARKKTIDFETSDAKFDQNLNDSVFTRQHLKEIATR
ncbi:MAG TPA: outer membrane lipoprotein-sorting protein [Blastocatellia bacterium]|nr:outer membrane lipoprotein-sorting protein [Blastocatellia bacterium]